MKGLIVPFAIAVALLLAGIGPSLGEQITSLSESSTGFGSSNVLSTSDSYMTGGFTGYQSTGTIVKNKAGTIGTVSVYDSQEASGVQYPFSAIGIHTTNTAGCLALTTDSSSQNQERQKDGTEISGISSLTLGGVAISDLSQFQFQAGNKGDQSEVKTADTKGFFFAQSDSGYTQISLNKKGTDQDVIGNEKVSAFGPVVLNSRAYQDILSGKCADNNQGINLGTGAQSFGSDANTIVDTYQSIVELNRYYPYYVL